MLASLQVILSLWTYVKIRTYGQKSNQTRNKIVSMKRSNWWQILKPFKCENGTKKYWNSDVRIDYKHYKYW